ARAQACVDLRLGPVLRMRMPGHHEEGRARPPLALELQDAVEAPVRIRAPELVPGDRGHDPRLPECRAPVAGTGMMGDAARGACHSPPRPAPRDVHVVRQRDGEAPAPPAGRLDSEAPPETLERRVE